MGTAHLFRTRSEKTPGKRKANSTRGWNGSRKATLTKSQNQAPGIWGDLKNFKKQESKKKLKQRKGAKSEACVP